MGSLLVGVEFMRVRRLARCTVPVVCTLTILKTLSASMLRNFIITR